MTLRSTITGAALAITLLAAPSGMAQNTGTYSEIENRAGCSVWNPNPLTNETVYWTGACIAGRAHGSGMIAYGNIRGGKATVSMHEVTLDNGRAQGKNIYYSYDGSEYARTHDNGVMRTSETYERGVKGELIDELAELDVAYSMFLPHRINGVDRSVLETIVEVQGWDYIRSGNAEDGSPYIDLKISGVDTRISATALQDGLYLGLVLEAKVPAKSTLTLDDVNIANKNAISAIYFNETNSTLKFRRYIILDYGVTHGNLIVQLKTFEDVLTNL